MKSEKCVDTMSDERRSSLISRFPTVHPVDGVVVASRTALICQIYLTVTTTLTVVRLAGMLQSAEEAKARIKTGQPILGYGWKEVQNFDDLDDLDEYESDEEVRPYSPLSAGSTVEHTCMLRR